MQDMTWYEIEAALREGADTVIIIASAQEQHGPHLPMATDFYWGMELARYVGRALAGRALIAPVIPFGPNEEMMAFPGTISLSETTLVAILRDMCMSFARHGFRYALLLTSHEGDFIPLKIAEDSFTDLDIEVIAFHDLGKLVEVMQKTAVDNGVDVQAAGAHAGEFETSIMMAAYPQHVRVAKRETGAMVDLSQQPDFFRQNLRKAAPNGIIGDATQATAEQGVRYYDSLSAMVVAHFLERTGES